MFISEEEDDDVKMIIPPYISSLIAVAILVQIITIRYFLKIMQS